MRTLHEQLICLDGLSTGCWTFALGKDIMVAVAGQDGGLSLLYRHGWNSVSTRGHFSLDGARLVLSLERDASGCSLCAFR